MKRGNAADLPVQVRRVRDQFEGWRRTKHGADRIPERLWQAAVKLCLRSGHTPHRIARWLRLNDTALRERARRGGAGRRHRRNRSRQAFVELVPPTSVTAGAAEYVVKVDGMRIRVRGATAADVAALARALRGEQKA